MRHLSLIAAAALSACVMEDADVAIDEATEAVEDGEQATQFDRNRTVRLSGCTGTRISNHHVITAAHCGVQDDDTVLLYTSSNMPSTTLFRKVDHFGFRPGVTVDDWVDTSGKFADIAIVELDDPISVPPFAVMAWRYPGAGAAGHKVGNGKHYEDPALTGLLLRKDDETWTESDEDGIFRTTEFALNHGDSGGPFYWGSKLLGVVNGSAGTLPLRARYTSIPEHLDWILDAIDYEWPGGPALARRRIGTSIESFSGTTSRVCAYACDNTPTCEVFNMSSSGTCELVKDVTASLAVSGWHTWIK